MADLRVLVKLLDTPPTEVDVRASGTVLDLKEAIEGRLRVPVPRQRLLHQSLLLDDSRLLSSYDIANRSLINLVAYSRQREMQEEEGADPLNDLFRIIAGSPAALISRRTRRPQQRREVTEAERIEAMRQSMMTLQSLLTARNRGVVEADQPLGFDYSRRTLQKGMWVDVKDTVDQWLEAQVIDVRTSAAGTQAFIHYNGWPNRWDEWIDARSPRIQPLRAKTFQSISAPMHSPYPIVSPDPPLPVPPSDQDLTETAHQASKLVTQTKSMMERYYSLHTIMKHERAVERVQPMQERLGMMHRSTGVQTEERKVGGRYEDRQCYTPSDSSEAVVGSEGFEDSVSMDEDPDEEWSDEEQMTTEQEFNLLSVQMAPILDRFGRLLCDLGVTISKDVNQQLSQRGDIPISSTMPTPAELYAVSSNQQGPDPGLQIALLTLRGRQDENRDSSA